MGWRKGNNTKKHRKKVMSVDWRSFPIIWIIWFCGNPVTGLIGDEDKGSLGLQSHWDITWTLLTGFFALYHMPPPPFF